MYENHHTDVWLSKNTINKLTSPSRLSRNNLHTVYSQKRNSEDLGLNESNEMRNSRNNIWVIGNPSPSNLSNSFAAAPLKGSMGFRSSCYNMGRNAYKGIYL